MSLEAELNRAERSHSLIYCQEFPPTHLLRPESTRAPTPLIIIPQSSTAKDYGLLDPLTVSLKHFCPRQGTGFHVRIC
jgi:hypothetical protein